MTRAALVARSLVYYWRGNLVVAAGVATAVAVLAGALIVGDSVRGSLRDLALGRLGATDVAVSSPQFFRAALADALAADDAFRGGFDGVVPLVAVDGFVTVQTSGRRAGRVHVYGVDERFWTFHARPAIAALEPRQAYVSAALSQETGAEPGMPILVRVERPSAIPLESLHARKDDPGRTMRATVRAVLTADDLGEFALNPEQRRTRAVFVSLAWLGEQLDIASRANTLIVSARDGAADSAAALQPILGRAVSPEDVGLTVRVLPDSHVVVVGAYAGFVNEPLEAAVTAAAHAVGVTVEPVLTYLANTIRVGQREVPYSLVTAQSLSSLAAEPAYPSAPPPIVLNRWLADDLRAKPGDDLSLDYYVWIDPGRLATERATFRVAGVRAIDSRDRDLAPVYPGITDSPTLDDWNPPFPVDLRRVRPADEAYWARYRTTPKAFVPLADGQRLWGSRHGRVTSLRLSPPAGTDVDAAAVDFVAALRRAWDPTSTDFVVRDVRLEALAASAGVTDFGEYFIYFSVFLVISALVLSALFFKLGAEERAREIGLLGALGARESFVQQLFLSEATLLAGVGAIAGGPIAVAYASAIVWLLRTWWVDAVGTTDLTVHVTPAAVAIGVVGGVVAALLCTWLTLRDLRRLTPRALLAGLLNREENPDVLDRRQTRRAWLAGCAAALAFGLMVAGLTRGMSAAGAFFGAATLMLAAGLTALSWWYRRPRTTVLAGTGWRAIARLGVRGAAAQPGRSAWATAVIASAIFILLAVDVFRRDRVDDTGPTSGLGGYALVAESLLPIAYDLGTAAGRDAVGLTGMDDVRFDAFRVRPGDDASCLNLYRPAHPRILGAPAAFLARGRFRFQSSVAETDAERVNPWMLLTTRQRDGEVPVIVDANSLTYVLHKKVGDVIDVADAGTTIHLRVVAALADSIFQRELIIAEDAFVRLFPEYEGYRLLLAEVGNRPAADVSTAIETGLSTFGVDVTSSADRLSEFHRVENTYLSTFQTLGGLGLLLGTAGLSAVLLRSVVERRRELALLRAVGYEPGQIRLMLLAESMSLLVAGVLVGATAAAVASFPAVAERGGRMPFSLTGGIVVAAVIAAGLLATILAARSVSRRPLLQALRSE